MIAEQNESQLNSNANNIEKENAIIIKLEQQLNDNQQLMEEKENDFSKKLHLKLQIINEMKKKLENVEKQNGMFAIVAEKTKKELENEKQGKKRMENEINLQMMSNETLQMRNEELDANVNFWKKTVYILLIYFCGMIVFFSVQM